MCTSSESIIFNGKERVNHMLKCVVGSMSLGWKQAEAMIVEIQNAAT